MFSKRIALSMLGAAMILATGAVPVSAARPARAVPTAERPLAPDEQAASNRKVAAAMDYLASAQARSFGRVMLACATPDATAPGTTDLKRNDLSAIGGHPPPPTATCPPISSGSPPAIRRAGHYCGPAVGQVIANYTWAVPLNANKYTQAQIAVWMRTDELGGTSAFTMADGLDIATARAPRRPANWDWVVTRLEEPTATEPSATSFTTTFARTSAACGWRWPFRSCRTRKTAAFTSAAGRSR